MEDEEVTSEESSTQPLSRREALRLGGLVAALGAGLGVVEPSEAQDDFGAAQTASVQMKFYGTPAATPIPSRPGESPYSRVLATFEGKLRADTVKLLNSGGGLVHVKLYVKPESARRLKLPGATLRDSVLLGQGMIAGEGLVQQKANSGGGLLQQKLPPQNDGPE